MARKPKRSRKAQSAPPRGNTDRDKAVDALMALLAEHSFEQIGLAEVAGRAGLKLSALRAEFGSTLPILAAHMKEIDRAVLAGGNADMAEEPPRERLFDVLMRRLEALAPYKEAVRSLHALGAAQSGSRARAQRHGGALAEMDAGGRRHRRARAARRVARARRRADVRARAGRLARRRRARPRPQHGRARPRTCRAPSAGTVSSAICVRCRNASYAARAAAARAATTRKWKRLSIYSAHSRASGNPGPRTLEPMSKTGSPLPRGRAVSAPTPAPAPSPASRRADCRRA